MVGTLSMIFGEETELKERSVRQARKSDQSENDVELFDSKTARLVSFRVHVYPDINREQIQLFCILEPSQTYKKNNV